MKHKIKSFVATLLLGGFLLTSCGTPKNVLYMTDAQPLQELRAAHPMPIKVQAGDKLSIVVKSRDPRLTSMFNMVVVANALGHTSIDDGMPQGVLGYEVDKAGNITFPELGELHVAGLTRKEIAVKIKTLLEERNLLKHAIITVGFENLTVSVLGEVRRPGQFRIEKDAITLPEMLSRAGDLSLDAVRTNIMVQREVGEGKYKIYRVDMTSAKDLMESPVYYLQQNDLIYVEPSKKRQRQTTVVGNQWRSPSLWLSLGSLLTTIAVIIKK